MEVTIDKKSAKKMIENIDKILAKSKVTDFIKRSIEIDSWLRAQGITVEPDEFAPAVFEWQSEWEAATPSGRYGVCAKSTSSGTQHRICPFYGPGGEGNLLKALVAYQEKKQVGDLQRFWNGDDILWRLYLPTTPAPAFTFINGKGKTDGEALSDLLWKIKEASE